MLAPPHNDVTLSAYAASPLRIDPVTAAAFCSMAVPTAVSGTDCGKDENTGVGSRGGNA